MRVFLVEPSAPAAAIVGRMLETHDHEVRTFADGHEALACIKSDPDVGALSLSPSRSPCRGWSCAGRPAWWPAVSGRSR